MHSPAKQLISSNDALAFSSRRGETLQEGTPPGEPTSGVALSTSQSNLANNDRSPSPSSQVQASGVGSSATGGYAYDRISIPMNIPAFRIPKDPLNGPIFEEENNDVYRYAGEGRRVIIGPMPVRAFLDDFLPPAPGHKPMPKCARAFKSVPLKAKDEREIIDSLFGVIEKDRRCPSVNFCITAGSRNEYAPGILQPEVCGFDVSLGPPAEDRGGDRIFKSGYKASLGFAELFVLVRKNGDPFCDTHSHDWHSKTIHKSFFAFENHRYQKERDFDAGREEKRNLGRAVGYASIACSRQHRVFYFSMLVFGTRARFMRWDRAGGVVTASFDYRQDPEFLCEFLWRFHHANPVQRGYDPTVTVASHAEEELFRTCIRRHALLQLGLSELESDKLDEAVTLHYEKGNVMKMLVYNRLQRKTRAYLVSVPLTSPKSANGRSTRAYWAVEPTGSGGGEVRFLKDVWRMDVGSVREEGLIYGEMGQAEVANICDLETFGDVPIHGTIVENGKGSLNVSNNIQTMYRKDREGDTDPYCRRLFDRGSLSLESEMDPAANAVQCTRTNDYTDQSWVCKCLRDHLNLRVYRHTHSRLVLKQAGDPLRSFTGSRELFGGVRDALAALDSAYRKCGRIHRDVSLGNIVLYREEACQPRRGLLADWEFSALVSDAGKSMDGLHTGTWAFMPARILRDCHDYNQTQADDMESLFYVALYGCLRWLPLRDADDLGRWIYNFFYEVKPGRDGRNSGGSEKTIQQAISGREFLEDYQFEKGSIQSFFKTGYKYLATTHIALKSRGAAMLWTMDNFLRLCTSVYDGLSSDDSTIHDRRENDISDYFPAAYGKVPGTQTCLLAEAIHFHADHGTGSIPSRQILEDAVDDIDDPSIAKHNQRGRKRGRHEALNYEGNTRRTKRIARGQGAGIRIACITLLDDESGRTLRSRHLGAGSFISPQGTRRSARLLCNGPSVGSQRTRHHT